MPWLKPGPTCGRPQPGSQSVLRKVSFPRAEGETPQVKRPLCKPGSDCSATDLFDLTLLPITQTETVT